MRESTISMATSLRPPRGMMTSVLRLDGLTNSRCMGRTVCSYRSSTASMLRPRSRMFRLSASAERVPDVGPRRTSWETGPDVRQGGAAKG